MRRLVPLLALLVVGAGPAHGGVPCGDATLNLTPEFSPDGSRVVFVSGGEGGCGFFGRLELASSSGGPPTQLTPDGMLAAKPRFSPDGTQILFTAAKADGEFPTGPQTVDVIGVRGGPIRTVASGADGAWVSNELIVLDRETQSFVVHADGTPSASLGAGALPQPIPGGRVLLTVGGSALYTVRDDGSDRRLVAPEFTDTHVAASPDGSQLAYLDLGLVVARVDGSAWHTYALPSDESLFGPIAWTGDRIVLGGGRVFDTVTQRFLRPFPQEDVVGVSADLEHLALALATGPPGYEGNDLYVAPADGREPRVVSPPRCDNVDCVAGTDGPDDLAPDSTLQTSIYGYGGNDVIRGGVTRTVVEASFGDDTIDGGPGNDRLLGGPGNDTIYGGAGNDYVDGGPGDDRLFSGAGGGSLHGGDGNDVLDARAGRGVAVYCGAGRDVAYVDSTDRVAKDCERVVRSRARP